MPRIDRLFAPDRDRARGGFLDLVISDYLAACAGAGESPRRLALMFLPRLANNPSLRATLLIRLALAGPRSLFGLWRSVLLDRHSIDLEGPIELGPGLVLPHPMGIVLGRGTRIGSNVRILNTVTIGARPGPVVAEGMCPRIGDGVTIWTQSIVVGAIEIGDGAVIGARTWIDRDVAPGEVVRWWEQQR